MQEWHQMPSATAELLPHPANPEDAIRRIGVAIAATTTSGEWRVHFRVEGDIGRLRIPAGQPALRTDGLWQHTCFETFLRPDASESYYEFNFSASGAWAAYRFSGRRAGRESPAMPAPRIDFRRGEAGCDMSAAIPLATLPEIARSPIVHAGLAVVGEKHDGQLAYWALAHRAAQPDFHDPETFTLRVAP